MEVWRKMVYRIAKILTVLALFSPLVTATPLLERYLLSGRVRGEPLQLELTLEASGHAAAQSIGENKQLEGRVHQGGGVTLRGAGLELRGRLPEPFEDGRPVFSGTLAGGEAFSLTIAASYLQRSTAQGPFLGVSSETPVFLAAPWRRVNDVLERFVQAPAAAFLRDGRQLSRRSELNYPYTYENRLEATHLSPSVLSLLERQFFYTGGAHPNTTYRSLNFYSDEGGVKRLTLDDLFRDGSDYSSVLLEEITQRLTAQNASMIRDGSITLIPRDLSVFNLTARGLRFTFAPYAVASYAEGTFAVTVPYEKLTSLLEPTLLP